MLILELFLFFFGLFLVFCGFPCVLLRRVSYCKKDSHHDVITVGCSSPRTVARRVAWPHPPPPPFLSCVRKRSGCPRVLQEKKGHPFKGMSYKKISNDHLV